MREIEKIRQRRDRESEKRKNLGHRGHGGEMGIGEWKRKLRYKTCLKPEWDH